MKSFSWSRTTTVDTSSPEHRVLFYFFPFSIFCREIVIRRSDATSNGNLRSRQMWIGFHLCNALPFLSFMLECFSNYDKLFRYLSSYRNHFGRVRERCSEGLSSKLDHLTARRHCVEDLIKMPVVHQSKMTTIHSKFTRLVRPLVELHAQWPNVRMSFPLSNNHLVTLSLSLSLATS